LPKTTAFINILYFYASLINPEYIGQSSAELTNPAILVVMSLDWPISEIGSMRGNSWPRSADITACSYHNMLLTGIAFGNFTGIKETN